VALLRGVPAVCGGASLARMTRPLHNCNERVTGALKLDFYRTDRDAKDASPEPTGSETPTRSKQEFIMKVKQVFALGALALATGAVLAQEAPVSRADVVQSVLAARAAGTLTPAGQGMDPGYKGAGPSQTTRAAVNDSVIDARGAGQLAHAGSVAPEEDMQYAQAHPSTSTLARAEVKQEVLEARADGTLIPAGQGEFTGSEQVVHAAQSVNPFHPLFARLAR
jgi:hypothetical protein